MLKKKTLSALGYSSRFSNIYTIFSKSVFRFSQETQSTIHPLTSYIKEKTQETHGKNAYKASNLIFKMNEKYAKPEIKDVIKTGASQILVAIFVINLIKSTDLFIAFILTNLHMYKKFSNINKEYEKNLGSLVKEIKINKDGGSVEIDWMYTGKDPLKCQITQLSFIDCSEYTESFYIKDGGDKNLIKKIEKKFTEVEIEVIGLSKNPTKGSQRIFARCYLDTSNDTFIPNMNLFKAIINGDNEEIQKYDLNANYIENGNDLLNFLPDSK